MTKTLLSGFFAAALVLSSSLAIAGGTYTNGYPTVGPVSANGVAAVAPNGLYSSVGVTAAAIPMDTNLAAGRSPQTVAISPFQVAAAASELIANQATSTVHAATLNTRAGLVTTEALSTAAGATYTFTLTNSLLVAGAAAPQVQILSGTNTGGAFTVTSVTNAVGSTVIVLTNSGTTALNGTILIAFHV